MGNLEKGTVFLEFGISNLEFLNNSPRKWQNGAFLKTLRSLGFGILSWNFLKMPHENGRMGHLKHPVLWNLEFLGLEFSKNAPRKWQNGAFENTTFFEIWNF